MQHTQTGEAENLAVMDRALEIGLPAEVFERPDTIWPNPGGETPEAYPR